jgi:serine/threonine protein kinase
MASFPGSVRAPIGSERQFGEYTLLLKLGWGGMADVFLARPPGGGEDDFVVVKRLKTDLAFDPEHQAMFKAEATLALRFDHPNVVKALAQGEVEGQPFLVMEYLEGQTLDRIIGTPGLSRGEALTIVSELLGGLEYAHELRDERGDPLEVVHRDVSPHNVFVTIDGRVKLVDFGIAKSRLGEQHTVTGVVKGKLAYMAPEQALADRIDRRTDLFAAGVILVELLSGKRYWASLSDVQILKAMTFGELPKLPTDVGDVRAVLERALTVTPAQRFETARAFREALDHAAEAGPDSGPVSASDLGASVTKLAKTEPDSVRQIVRAQVQQSRARAEAPLFVADRAEISVTQTSDGQALPAVAPTDAERPSHAIRSRAPLFASAALFAGAIVFAAIRFASSTPVSSETRGAPARSSAIPTVSATLEEHAATPSASAVERPSPRDQIILRILAAPPTAKIRLDGAEVATNPFVAKFTRDGVAHRVVVSAPGYIDSDEIVVFDQDRAIERRLVSARAGAPSVGPTQPSATPVTTSTGASPGVDKRDPWLHH